MNISTLRGQKFKKCYDFVTLMVIKDTLAPTFPVWFSRMWTDARPDTENLDKFVSWSRKLQSDLGFATCVNVYLLS